MDQLALVEPPLDTQLKQLIRMAICEDVAPQGFGGNDTVRRDLTVELSIPEGRGSTANIVARQAGVLSGGYLLGAILREYSPGLAVEVLAGEGSRLVVDQVVARISGPTRALLSAERVCLNFLSHLSGIATLTRRYVEAVAGVINPPAICDTRKTTPGYRVLDKYAVRCGGGTNHRMGLYDGVMLKDNHLAALRDKLGAECSLAQLTAHVRGQLAAGITLWLEVDTLEQLRAALPGGGADVILLDNFAPGRMREAVALRDEHAGRGVRRPLLEASGGITLENVAAVAATGVERISIGALTHSAAILDLSMELV